MVIPPVLNPAPVLSAAPNPTERRTYSASFLVLLAGGVCIGFAPICVRLSEVGPVSTAFWRMAISLPALWAALAWSGRRRVDSPVVPDKSTGTGAGSWGPMTLAGALFAADLACWHWSLHFTSVTNATLLPNFAPVFVVLFGWLTLGYRVTWRFVGAMAIALTGTCLLVGRDFQLQSHALRGDTLALITAAFYGSYQLAIKTLRDRHGTLVIMVRSSLAAAALLLPAAVLSGERFWPRTGHGWLVLAALALIVHAGGQGMIAYAMARLPAAVASVSLLVQPVTAALAAAALLREPVAAIQAAGVALVLTGVFIARQDGR